MHRHTEQKPNTHSNLTLPYVLEQLIMVYPIIYKLSWGNLATPCCLSHTTLSSGKTRQHDRVRLFRKSINMSFQELQNMLIQNILTFIQNFLLCKHWGFLGAIIYLNSGVCTNMLHGLRFFFYFFFKNSVILVCPPLCACLVHCKMYLWVTLMHGFKYLNTYQKAKSYMVFSWPSYTELIGILT